MNRAALALVALTLVGCGKPGLQDSEFAAYVGEYAKYRNVDPTWLTITGVTTIDAVPATPGSTVIGLCELPSGHVSFNTVFYDNAPAIQKKALVFHELEHCLLGAVHINTIGTDGCATNYMNAFMPSPNCLAEIFTTDGIPYNSIDLDRALSIKAMLGLGNLEL